MISATNTALAFLVVCLLSSQSAAFYVPSLSVPQTTTTLHGEGTGGWGLGNSREMVPEEFANRRSGERKAFEGYNLADRGQFMRKVRKDAEDMRSSELDELLGVAKIAGINVKDPSERLNKFDEELLDDGDEDLDLSV